MSSGKKLWEQEGAFKGVTQWQRKQQAISALGNDGKEKGELEGVNPKRGMENTRTWWILTGTDRNTHIP